MKYQVRDRKEDKRSYMGTLATVPLIGVRVDELKYLIRITGKEEEGNPQEEDLVHNNIGHANERILKEEQLTIDDK